jgi:tRNA A-37 threonylcarbamoyl transferase component Bud32
MVDAMGLKASGGPEASDVTGWAPKPGELVGGKFVVEHVIGVGGMGIVVAARHAHLDQTVAIKFLRRDAAKDDVAVNRFLRESRAVAVLQSEHVVRVMDAGRLDDGLPYLVMEHLVGADLDALLAQRGPLPLDEAVGYLLQAMEAVAEAHAAGIVHRDLKPSNLFMTKGPDGSPHVKVLDFGISKAVDGPGGPQMSLTATSMTLGSPLYMSPEQVRSSKNVDFRIDVWALGVIAYELLAGVPPFEADTVTGLCAKIVADEPTSLRSMRPDISPSFEAIVLRCLEKNVAARYQSVGELAAALRPFASAEGQASVTRIGRIGGASKGTLASAQNAAVPATTGPKAADPEAGYAETVASWQTAGGRPSKRFKAATTAALGALALVTALVAAKWPRGNREPKTAAATVSAVAAAAPTAGPTIEEPLPAAKPDVTLIAPAASPALPVIAAPSAVASSPPPPPPVTALWRPAPPKPAVGPAPAAKAPAAKTPEALLLDRK